MIGVKMETSLEKLERGGRDYGFGLGASHMPFEAFLIPV